MNRPKLARSLRIAWSVAWGILAVATIAAWVRNKYAIDGVVVPLWSPEQFVFTSRNGGVGFGLGGNNGSWYAYSFPATQVLNLPYKTALGFVQYTAVGMYRVRLPDWFLFAMFCGVAVAPWLRWRFSLRTLLIATTIVAVGLGLIVWLR